MDISKLVKFTNDNYIISENLRGNDLYGYMDQVIDDINDGLQATFPTISEWASYVESYNTQHATDPGFVALKSTDYTAFPAKYLRTVVAVGAAFKFFTNDEEGEQSAKMYYATFAQGLSNMVRDYINLVPVEFQNNEGGYVSTSYNDDESYDNNNEGIVMSNDVNTL